MNQFSIQDIAQLSGIKAHTLRIWEQRYSIIKPSRTESNIRWYDNDDLKKILNIALLNEHGIKISKLSAMTAHEINEAVINTRQESGSKEDLHQLLGLGSEMDALGFEKKLNEIIEDRGICETVETVIFPLLEKVGMLWTTNRIFSSQEHLISYIIRQKLITAIDHLQKPKPNAAKVLLFLPEGEFHELGLLYAHFLFKRKRLAVVSLGANLPLEELTIIAGMMKPKLLYTHLTAVGTGFNALNFIQTITKAVKNTQFAISGFLVSNIIKAPPKTSIIRSISDLKQLIDSI